MAIVSVSLGLIGPRWTAACKQAVIDLNRVFLSSGINVTLAYSGSGPVITVRVDPTIHGGVHGETETASTEAGQVLSADVRLPIKATVNTPRGVREVGAGVYEVVAAHEFVHGLGHDVHNTHLMPAVMNPATGDHAAGDKLLAGSIFMPPLQLSETSVTILKGIWGAR